MKPIDFPEVNRELQAPAGQEAQVDPLPVHVTNLEGKPAIISCWQPTDEERQAIADGQPIWLFVYGSHTQPPVGLTAAPTVFRHVDVNGEQP